MVIRCCGIQQPDTLRANRFRVSLVSPVSVALLMTQHTGGLFNLIANESSLPGWSSLLLVEHWPCHACLTLMHALVCATVLLIARSGTVFENLCESSI